MQGVAPEAPSPAEESASARSCALLDQVTEPVPSAEVTLASGRRYELGAGESGDRVVVRSSKGEVILRVEVTDSGPVLSFSGADVEIAAVGRLSLVGGEVSVRAAGDIDIDAGRCLRERAGTDHHTRVSGSERVEAARVEVQASEAGIAMKAMEAITLDGEHIGLNGDPRPQPFPWSEIARDAATSSPGSQP